MYTLQGVPSELRLGFVDLDYECSTVCPTLLGLMGIWQKRLGSLPRWWNTDIKVNPTQVSAHLGHPAVHSPSERFFPSQVPRLMGVRSSYTAKITLRRNISASKSRNLEQTILRDSVYARAAADDHMGYSFTNVHNITSGSVGQVHGEGRRQVGRPDGGRFRLLHHHLHSKHGVPKQG